MKDRKSVLLRRKDCKNKMHLHESFAKHQVDNFLFYIIDLDDVSLLFTFTFQGLSTWECNIE